MHEMLVHSQMWGRLTQLPLYLIHEAPFPYLGSVAIQCVFEGGGFEHQFSFQPTY